MENITQIDTLWLLACSLVVLFMQVGFLALECGLTRPKNSINVAVKNITDLTITFLLFYGLSYQLMFGETLYGLFGITKPDIYDETGFNSSFFIFQAVFCSSTVTILSGAIAERIKFKAYVLLVLLIGALIYPIFGHWVFAGTLLPQNSGWLGTLGFTDFAGASNVHMIGGTMSLITCLYIGPRTHRFNNNGVNHFNGANIPLSIIGTLFLMVGWFGFNAGSLYRFDGHDVSKIFINTFGGASVGLISTLALGYYLTGKARVDHLIAGLLGGLVFTTAGADKMTFAQVVLFALPIAPIIIYGKKILIKMKVDDAVDAIPVHLFCAVWGVLSVAFIGDNIYNPNQLFIQLTGVITCLLWCTVTLVPGLYLINKLTGIRISEEEEDVGLNIAEHGESTEISDFLKTVSTLETEDDYFSIDIPKNNYTEVGQIGALFDELLNKIKEISSQRTKVAYKSGVAENAIEVLHSIGNTITPMAIKVNDLKEMKDLECTGHLLRNITKTLETKLQDESLMIFLKEDQKGKTVLPILTKIVEQINETQNKIEKNGREMGKKIENISQIITLQQRYANTDQVDKKTVQVSRAVEDAYDMINELMHKHNIKFNFNKSDELYVVCSSNKLMQVLMNFYKNSIESINEQREIENVEGEIQTHLKLVNGSVQLEIKDNGRGFTEDVKNSIFNFGYSTKDRGSGFGLHDCYNFAKSNEGSIDIDSDGLGHGAIVTLKLPVKVAS